MPQIRKNYKKYSVFGKPIFGEDKKIKNNYQFVLKNQNRVKQNSSCIESIHYNNKDENRPVPYFGS